MIFVILGTQDKKFNRLIQMVLKLDIDEEIVIQSGCSDVFSDKVKYFKYLDKDSFDDYIKKADLIITHGGVGSIMSALSYRKKVIAVPRLKKYQEHQNDHQLDIVDNFYLRNYIFKCNEEDDLKLLITKIKTHQFENFNSNNDHFVSKLNNYLDL